MKRNRMGRRMTAMLAAVLFGTQTAGLGSLAAPAGEPVVAVGSGQKTDGSDEWVLEYIEDTTANRKIYYLKNKATDTYLTSNARYATSNAGEFKEIALTLEAKDESNPLQKWIVQPQSGGYLLYIHDGHCLTISEANTFGLVYQAYSNIFTIGGFQFDGTEETVKLHYKGSGKYLAVQLPGSEPEEPELDPPSGNALRVTNRGDRNHGFKIDVTSQLSPSVSYCYGAYIKLCETPAAYEYMRLSIQITYTDASGASGKTSWKTTPFATLSAGDYTLVAMNFDTNNLAGGSIQDAYIYVDTYSGESAVPPASPAVGSRADFLVDAAFLCEGTLFSHGGNLLENGQFEYGETGVVSGYEVHHMASIACTQPFADEKTPGTDGSVTYKAGVVDPADTNLRLLGRWVREAAQLKGYFQSSLELRFTGTSLRMTVNSDNLFYSIDGGENRKLSSSGEVTLAENLTDGAHVVRLCSNYQEVKPVITRIKLDPGAATLPPPDNKSILFIGDSITVSYFGSAADGYVNGFLDGYAVQTAEALGLSYAGTAYGGIAILPGEGTPDAAGMPVRYFKLGEQNSDAALLPYDTSTYQPDYICICLGTNGSNGTPAVKSAYADFLAALRAAYAGAVIFCMTPFTDKNVGVIREAAESRAAAGDSGVHFIDSSAWIDCSAPGVTSDGTHPVPASHTLIAQRLSAAIAAILTPRYTVTVTQPPAGGTVSVSADRAAAGETITVTAAPAAGYKLRHILTGGQPIEGNTFSMPAGNIGVTAVFDRLDAETPGTPSSGVTAAPPVSEDPSRPGSTGGFTTAETTSAAPAETDDPAGDTVRPAQTGVPAAIPAMCLATAAFAAWILFRKKRPARERPFSRRRKREGNRDGA